MKKIIVLLCAFICLCFASVALAAGFSYSDDLKLGIYTIGDTYDQAKAEVAFGKLVKTKKLHNKKHGPTMYVQFAKAYLSLRNNTVMGVASTSPDIKTPKGVAAGQTVAAILEKYGDTAATASDGEGNTLVVYGGDGAELIFTVSTTEPTGKILGVEVYSNKY